MRHEHETATIFNELKAITQAMRALKNGAPKNATNQANANERLQKTQTSANAKAHTQEPTQARAQTSDNANTSEITHQSTPKPKATTHAKNHALKPTKRAFSERQNTAFKDHSQARANLSFKTKASHNANAFESEQDNNYNLRAKPSAKALKQGLKNTQSKRGQQQ
ncbi:hypothetical protein KVJ70_00165 [Helicobacter pylori]|nr:hypothetical protein KVJ70_00165 [Helicobacter pylori]